MAKVDLYEYAYQNIAKSIAKKNLYIQKSDLRRKTIEEIRRRLKLHITLEDIDANNFIKWTPIKKLMWLQDLNEFVYKTLGKKRYIRLRELRNRE